MTASQWHLDDSEGDDFRASWGPSMLGPDPTRGATPVHSVGPGESYHDSAVPWGCLLSYTSPPCRFCFPSSFSRKGDSALMWGFLPCVIRTSRRLQNQPRLGGRQLPWAPLFLQLLPSSRHVCEATASPASCTRCQVSGKPDPAGLHPLPGFTCIQIADRHRTHPAFYLLW